jgi:arginyl-tRNA--protein-N-Asp/Glu arginylyltransferase
MQIKVPPDKFQIEWTVTPERMDEFWATGWRHFGPLFFRRYVMTSGDQVMAVQPLRIVLDRFHPSKNQRRVLRRNMDLSTRIKPTVLNQELHKMFADHAQRFTFNVPSSLGDFLGEQPNKIPCRNVTIAVNAGEKLIAASFLDLGMVGVSSVYGIFDPTESRRSLGIFTMLKEIEYAKERGFRFYYPGYTSKEPSAYDYKKKFVGLECYDWQGNWRPLLASCPID